MVKGRYQSFNILTNPCLTKKIFEELTRKFGCNYSLVKINTINPKIPIKNIKGLLCCSQWLPSNSYKLPLDDDTEQLDTDNIYFAAHVDPYSTLMITIINFLINTSLTNRIDNTFNNIIHDIATITNNMNPKLRGLCIHNSGTITDIYNTLLMQHSSTISENVNTKIENNDTNWFRISLFINKNKSIFELDSFQDSPIKHNYNEKLDNNWTHHVLQIIKERITKYELEDIEYNVWLIVENHSSIPLSVNISDHIDTQYSTKDESKSYERFFKEFFEKVCRKNSNNSTN